MFPVYRSTHHTYDVAVLFFGSCLFLWLFVRTHGCAFYAVVRSFPLYHTFTAHTPTHLHTHPDLPSPHPYTHTPTHYLPRPHLAPHTRCPHVYILHCRRLCWLNLTGCCVKHTAYICYCATVTHTTPTWLHPTTTQHTTPYTGMVLVRFVHLTPVYGLRYSHMPLL